MNGRRPIPKLQLVLGCLAAAHLALAAARLPEGWRALLARARLPVVERGALGADERAGYPATAGQVRLRERLSAASARERTRPSAASAAWRRLHACAAELPAGSRVHLDLPLTVFYYSATFFCWPHRVDVDGGAALITDEATLARAAVAVPAGAAGDAELARRGFTHRLSAVAGGLELTPLPRGAP